MLGTRVSTRFAEAQRRCVIPQQSEEQADKRRKKEANYLLRTWQTKSTHVYHLNFTWSNLLLGAGALTLPHYAL